MTKIDKDKMPKWVYGKNNKGHYMWQYFLWCKVCEIFKKLKNNPEILVEMINTPTDWAKSFLDWGYYTPEFFKLKSGHDLNEEVKGFPLTGITYYQLLEALYSFAFVTYEPKRQAVKKLATR